MLRIGIIGAGHLGKIHIKCLKEIPEFYITGFYDSNSETAKAVEQELGIPAYTNMDTLIEAVDVIDIVTPTISHFTYAMKALKKFKHVFIEKPIVTTLDEAQTLINTSKEADVKIQVGHVERFNPAFTGARDLIQNPMFIEGHRLSMFSPRGTDVPVVLDLMIHDIDLVLSVVNSNVKKIHASGVHVVSDTPDIANARIEFDNGCVANLTASRISMKSMRKLRFFQPYKYISLDLLEKKSEVISISDATEQALENPFALLLDLGEGKGKKEIQRLLPECPPVNAIKEELRSFYHSVVNNEHPVVGIFDGYRALEIAHRILEKIDKKTSYFL